MDLQKEIAAIQEKAGNAESLKAYTDLVDILVGKGLADHLQHLLDHLIDENCVQPIVSRPAMEHLAREIKSLKDDPLRTLCQYAISKLEPRVLSFEEADKSIKKHLADILINEEDYSQAAMTLSSIGLDQHVSDKEKAQTYLRIAELYLADDDTVTAETFIKKTTPYLNAVSDDLQARMRYQVSYGRILDAKRNFLEASRRFYNISLEVGKKIEESDLMELLNKAIVCTILAKAGPQRSRMLGALFKDARTRRSTHTRVLESMYKQRLLKKADCQTFDDSLMAHQKATLADGSTVLEKAVTEHNMLACAKLYHNISFQELGSLLEISPERAEHIAATMISEERLRGSIDQIDGLLSFIDDNDSGRVNLRMHAWDSAISSVCTTLNNCVEQVVKTYPSLKSTRSRLD